MTFCPVGHILTVGQFVCARLCTLYSVGLRNMLDANDIITLMVMLSLCSAGGVSALMNPVYTVAETQHAIQLTQPKVCT